MAKEAVAEKRSSMGGWALIFGILSFLLCWVPVIGLLLSITTVILSGKALGKQNANKGNAIAGLVLGIIALIISITVTAIVGMFAGSFFFVSSSLKGTTLMQPISAGYTVQIGERAVVDNLAYVVNSAVKMDSIKSENASLVSLLSSSPSDEVTAEGVFIVINLTIENIGNESKNLYISRLNIVDSLGRKFSSLGKAESAYGGKIDFGKQLQPGLPVHGTKVFDIPKNSTGLKLEVGSSSLFSSKAVDIALGI